MPPETRQAEASTTGTSAEAEDSGQSIRQLAEKQSIVSNVDRDYRLLESLEPLAEYLDRTHRTFSREAQEEKVLSSHSAEWVLDNYYIVQEAMRQINKDLKRSYYRELPKLSQGKWARFPRVYVIARAYVKRQSAQVRTETLKRFTSAYQETQPLSTGELWAIPTMLRICVLQTLAGTLSFVRNEPAPFAEPPVQPSPELPAHTLVGNCILSLRAIADQDWKDFYEDVSLLEKTLLKDPAGVYGQMDFATRDHYRKAVEKLSKETDFSELEIAQMVVALARQGATSLDSGLHERQHHVGYYLIDAGQYELQEKLAYRPGLITRIHRWFTRDHPTFTFLGGISLLTLFLLAIVLAYGAAVGASHGALILIAVLVLVPALSLATSLITALLLTLVRPYFIPKLDYKDGVPENRRTMVVVPCLIAREEDVDNLFSQLELHHLRNNSRQITFALLSDFADAAEKDRPEDETLLLRANEVISALNKRYPGSPFYFFHRERLWNEQEGVWMGWERKRGKLEEFNKLLRGNAETSYTVQLGDLSILPDVRYVITLDADTILPLGAGQRLIGALAHPLNRAHFNDDNGRVSAGYTVLQPRIEIEPISGYRTRFSRIYSGTSGFDLYTNAVSDIYQDLFGEGIYVGKGIYEVDPFVRSLEDRTPENILLSHDLFEGIHGRAGLVSDITLYEEYPPDYLIFAQRRHRWIRGDWQLLPWLQPRVFHREHGSVPNTLSAINLWKVIDNLRRSLLPIALLALLVAGWLWLPGSPLVWTLVAVLASAGALLSGLVVRLIQRMTQDGHSDGLVAALQQQLSRWLLSLTFLPYEALIAGDAITTALVRLFITRKQLLQWTTAANAVRLVSGSDETGMIRREMVSATIIAVLLSGLTGWLNPGALVVALPFLLAWALSPVIAVWLSRPVNLETAELESQQVQYLHRLARMTWRYFEQFMGPEDHWLPPDHFQEHPRGLVAHRTSPTNIGLGLLSTLGAYDMGYISLQELALRLQYTFQTLDRLECHRGHFLNWYDTRTIQPLPPRYVSTVDSGNLAACLLTLQKGCDEMPDLVLPRWERWQGLLDTVAVLRDILNEDTSGDARQVVMSLEDELDALHRHIEDHKDLPEQWTALLTYLATEAWPQIEKSLVELVEMRVLSAEQLHRIRIWTEAMRHALMDMKRRHSTLTPWLPALDDVPAFFRHPQGNGVDSQPQLPEWDTLLAELPAEIRVGEIADVCQAAMMRMDRLLEAMDMLDAPGAECSAARAWCVDLRQKLEEASAAVTESLATYTSISAQCHELVYGMAFDFLYDRRRNLFRIGYNVDTEQLDPNYYDLLASEARTASLIAIAMGEVPQRHWLMLGRPLRNLNGVPTLISWSGSMFEYLMPILWTRQYSQSLLEQSTRAAVQAQIAYGHQRNVPWGISEAGYYRFDAAMNYQYKSFGVPQLALKRGLEDDLVVSPYASLLALPLQPQAVMENLQRLREIDMRSDYGYYESVDYTEARLALGQDYARVRSLMVHHQGMIFLSLVNTLGGDRMVQRFHSHPHIRSVELLLQERMPNRVITAKDDTATESAPYMRQKVTLAPWDVPVDTPAPRVNYLSNGRYGVLITNAGGGFSRWRDTDLTRWRADTTSDDWGSWIYVQDLNNGKLWSISAQPIAEDIKHHEVTFSAHKVDFKYQVQEITAHTEVTVPPDDDLEIRHVQITNHSSEPRHLRLISYAEVILNGQESDRRHPAFNKLFIEGKYAAAHHALIFTRRPRSSEEKSPVMAHQVVVEPGREWTVSYETDRERFLGRGGGVHNPKTLSSKKSELSNNANDTLDPIMCQAIEIEIPAHSAASVAFLTLAGEDEDDVITLLEKYDDWMAINRAFRRADARSASELRQLELDTASLQEIQKLLSYLLFPRPSMRADIKTLVANEKGQPGLWAYAISGDYPILLARIYGEEDLQLARRLLKGHTFWRNRGLQIDLVFLNEVPGGYNQELQSQLRRLLQRMDSEHWENRRGGIFLLQKGVMSTADQILLQTAARVVVDAQRGPLEAQLHEAERQDARLPGFIPTDATHPRSEDPQLVRPPDLLFDNGWGGFIRSGREYVMYLHAGDPTPAPWINVIANSTFGCLVSESGSGFSWAVNSGENRLTPWNNDPVCDRPGEALYLRDEETAEVWTTTPSPSGTGSPRLVRHGAGYTCFEAHSHGLRQNQRIFVAPEDPVKIVQLRLENTWDRPRRITATYYAEWVLGAHRDLMQQYIIAEYDAASNVLLARNAYNSEFAERVAFLAASEKPHGLTADRTEFLGRLGSVASPAALRRVGLASNVQPGLDPCAALQLHVELQPGETQEIHFVLGQGTSREESLRLAIRFQDKHVVQDAWQHTNQFWDDFLEKVQIQTPDETMNIMLNRWLPYQNLSCRIWGRSALYQSSGAYGFRDQLQDVLALRHHAPGIARKHILRAAQHQFEAGDVLHWWHPPSGRGVRTRISDDLLWLPYVTASYITLNGDYTILDEEIPFRRGDPLRADEEERYSHYELTEDKASLFEHCCRAIEAGSTAGPDGLPLIGAGDWNDGFNRVGIEGKGESVWLGWFLYATLDKFLPICRKMDDTRRVQNFEQTMLQLQQALAHHTWDGNWYRRAYYDDGKPLGSVENKECRIDSIAQSWAVISGAGDPDRIAAAMASMEENLICDEERIVLLFTPPFDKSASDPGYIKGYPPGIRENGGQYTHAAVWAAWAYAELGNGDQAGLLFRYLNAITHSDGREKAAHYRVEPYVTAADVYGAAPFTGRGGWTWYTGSAGWLYQLGLEAILGLKRRGKTLSVAPCIPANWTGYTIIYRYGSTAYKIVVANPEHVCAGVASVTLDGEPLPDKQVVLEDHGGQHILDVRMGKAQHSMQKTEN